MTLSLERLALTETETLDEVLQCLAENFSIKTQGACDQKTLFEILVRAASNGDTIENTAKTLKKTPSGNDIRYHLNIWINILWQKISRKRKGRRLIYRELFSLKQMLAFLRQAVDKIHEVVEGIYLPSG